MQAGKMNHWAILLDRTTGTNEFNEPSDGNQNTTGFWVEYMPTKGEDVNLAGKVASRVICTLRTHWRNDVATDARIGLGDLTLNVISVLEIGLKEGIEIWCAEAKGPR